MNITPDSYVAFLKNNEILRLHLGSCDGHSLDVTGLYSHGEITAEGLLELADAFRQFAKVAEEREREW